MRRALVALVVSSFVLGVVATGPAQESVPSADTALSYLPADNSFVLTVPTDFRTQDFETFDDRVVFPVLSSHADELLRDLLRYEIRFKGSFNREIRPQLGHELAVSVRSRIFVDGWGIVAALQVNDGPALLRLLRAQPKLRADGTAAGGAHLFSHRRSRQAFVALDGDVLVLADSERRLRRALARHDAGTGMTAARFTSRLGDLPQDALIRAVGDLRPLLQSRPLRRLLRIPWAASLRDARGTISVDDDRIRLDGALDTDPSSITDDELPLETGDSPPALIRSPGRISGASTNQSQATVFLLRAARAAFPRSRFVRDVARVERRLGIDFEHEVLRQFDGPSASVLTLDGGFAARSAVRDPAALATTMRRLAPHLPRLIKDLQSLETAGLSLLLLFAPDAPVAPVAGAANHLDRRRFPVRVRHLPGQPDFYRVSGLCCDGPGAFYFGLHGGVFVIGSTQRRAKAISTAPAEAPSGAAGTSVLGASLESLRRRLRDLLWFDPGRLGDLTGFLNATRERLRGSLGIELR